MNSPYDDYVPNNIGTELVYSNAELFPTTTFNPDVYFCTVNYLGKYFNQNVNVANTVTLGSLREHMIFTLS